MPRTCPHCGYDRQPYDERKFPAGECPRCGERYDAPASRPRGQGEGATHGGLLYIAATLGILVIVYLLYDHPEGRGALAFIITFTAGGLIYLLPLLIATSRRHHNAGAIAALDILLGWTLLGWVAAFVWSLTVVRPPPETNDS